MHDDGQYKEALKGEFSEYLKLKLEFPEKEEEGMSPEKLLAKKLKSVNVPKVTAKPQRRLQRQAIRTDDVKALGFVRIIRLEDIEFQE